MITLAAGILGSIISNDYLPKRIDYIKDRIAMLDTIINKINSSMPGEEEEGEESPDVMSSNPNPTLTTTTPDFTTNNQVGPRQNFGSKACMCGGKPDATCSIPESQCGVEVKTLSADDEKNKKEMATLEGKYPELANLNSDSMSLKDKALAGEASLGEIKSGAGLLQANAYKAKEKALTEIQREKGKAFLDKHLAETKEESKKFNSDMRGALKKEVAKMDGSAAKGIFSGTGSSSFAGISDEKGSTANSSKREATIAGRRTSVQEGSDTSVRSKSGSASYTSKFPSYKGSKSSSDKADLGGMDDFKTKSVNKNSEQGLFEYLSNVYRRAWRRLMNN